MASAQVIGSNFPLLFKHFCCLLAELGFLSSGAVILVCVSPHRIIILLSTIYSDIVVYSPVPKSYNKNLKFKILFIYLF